MSIREHETALVNTWRFLWLSIIVRLFPSKMTDITRNTSVFSETVNLTNNNDLIDYDDFKNILLLTEQHIMYKIGESMLKVSIRWGNDNHEFYILWC